MPKGSKTEFDPIRDLPLPDPNSPTYSADLKSFVSKILALSPFPPRFYRDIVCESGPNSNLANILRNSYKNIFHEVDMTLQQSQPSKSSRSCTHIKASGTRCESPSLRGEQFCYFHQRMHRGVRTPPQARLHPIALIEDEESIQVALMEVMNALLRNTIDLKRATLILRALHIAVKNSSRVRFPFHGNKSIRDIPEYNAAPPDQALERTEIDPPLTAAIAYQPDHESAADKIRADKIREDELRYAAKMQAAVDRQADIRARLERAAQTLSPAGRATPATPPPQPASPTPTVRPDGTAHLGTAAPAPHTASPAAPARAAADAPVRKPTPPSDPRAAEPIRKKPATAVKEVAAPLAAAAGGAKPRKPTPRPRAM